MSWHNTNMTDKPRAVIYCRISQDREGAGLGVERQEADCRALAERNGWEVVSVLVDNDISAFQGRKKRPGYQELLEQVRAGTVAVVVAWHTDRLHRSLRELLVYMDACEPHHVASHTVTAGPVDLATASGRMMAKMLGAIAEHESEHKAERIRRAQLQKSQAGLWIGGTRPFGWRINASGLATIDHAEAEVIREACRLVLEGVSLGSIIRDINAAGTTTSVGKAWTYATMRQTLKRPRNAGLVTYGGDVVNSTNWPAVVSEATFRSVTALLEDPLRRTTTSNSVKWLMAGIATCECGANVRSGSVGRRDGTKASIYRCRATGPGHVGRRAHDVDALVQDVILERLRRPDIRELLSAGDRVDNADLRAEADRFRLRLAEVAEMYAADELSRAQLQQINRTVGERLQAVEAQMTRRSRDASLTPFLTGNTDPAEVWEALGIEKQRAVVRALVDVRLLRTNRESGRFFNPETVEFTWKTA